MAKRGGKAASRRSRQRASARQAAARRAPARPASAAVRPPAPAAEAQAPSAEATPTPAALPPAYRSGPSGLSERARLEYHYVARDLRNIGILVVVMAALLGVAAIVLSAVGFT